MMEENKRLVFLIGSRNKSNLLLKYLLINGGYKVLLIEHSPNILKYIEEELPSLLIFDFRISDMEWFNLVKEVKENNITKMIPFTVTLNRTDRKLAPKLYEQGVDHILFKPISREDTLDEIKGILIKSERSRDNLLSRAGLEGNLKDMGIVEIIQTLDMNDKTGILRIMSGDDVGIIYFNKGKMQKAKTQNLKDENAIYRILQWREGAFSFQLKKISTERILKLSDQEIIMEGMKRLDDLTRIISKIGGETAIPYSCTIKESSVFMDLTQLQKTIYLKLDGKKDIGEYLKYNTVGDIELLEAFMQLNNQGLISFKTPAKTSKNDGESNKKRIRDIFKNVEDIFSNIN